MVNNLTGLLVLPRIKITNANLISGPLTYGFPAMTAFLGVTHNLERHFPDLPYTFVGTGVVCHRFTPQASRSGYMYTLHLNRFPVDAKGESASFVEDGRVHLDVSLVVGVRWRDNAYVTQDEGERLAAALLEAVQGMRVAGGSVIACSAKPIWQEMPAYEQEQAERFRPVCRRLMPGFALVDRSDLLRPRVEALRQQKPDASALDALLDICALHSEPHTGDDDACVWKTFRRQPGWIVPIPVGYRAISPLYAAGEVKNARDDVTPFRFVESIASLGEWKSPHRLHLPQELLWTYQANAHDGVYRCVSLAQSL